MAKFPEPPEPAELARIAPEIAILPTGTELWRVYFRGGPHPSVWNALRSYGPTNARFDHQLAPPHEQASRRILYAAKAGATCLVEVFQDTRFIDRKAREPWLVAFLLTRPVELLDLRGPWPTRAGASMAIASGQRARARRWSSAIHHAYPTIEGLLYPSSMAANQDAVAIYERAADAFSASPTFHRPLLDPALRHALARVAWEFGYGLA